MLLGVLVSGWGAEGGLCLVGLCAERCAGNGGIRGRGNFWGGVIMRWMFWSA